MNIEINVETSCGHVILYVAPDGWSEFFLTDAAGAAVREARGLVLSSEDLVACLTRLGITPAEAEEVSRTVMQQFPESHPSSISYSRRFVQKALEVIERLPDLPFLGP